MEESQTNLTYYILREKYDEPGDIFNIFVDDLKRYIAGNNVIQEKPGVMSISADSRQKGIVEYNPPEIAERFSKFQFRAKLTIAKEDAVNLHLIKMLAARARVRYRIFSTLYDCFLPVSTDLENLEFGLRDEKLAAIFSQFDLKPIYYNQHFGCYYALTIEQEVVLVNKYLIDYLYGKDIPEKQLPDLCYVVAGSMESFGLKYDRRLIPTDFYEYYEKQIKIVNCSNFNINNPGRKVFVKPYIFELRQEMGEFYQMAGNDGQALLLMDKIRPGETLDQTLVRVVRDELKIAEDYLAAYVSDNVEFDRDRDGDITPRLVVWVYVDKIVKERPKVMQMSQTGWKSLGGQIPQVNVKEEFNQQFS
jgi:hypothetical protein